MSTIISTDNRLIKNNSNNDILSIKNLDVKIKCNRPIKTNMLFEELLLLWLDNNKIKLKHTTYVKYYEVIINHLIPKLGKFKIKKIDANLINSFLEKKLSNGRLDGKGGLSTGSVKMMIYIIKSAFSFALEKDLIKKSLGKIASPPSDRAVVEVFSISEQMTLEKYLTHDMDESKLGVLIALNTGLRIGEICGLKWEDIDFNESTISIKRTVQRIKNINAMEDAPRTMLVVGEPKTVFSRRIVPISSYLIEYIHHFYEIRKSEFILSGNSHEFLDPRTYQYRYNEYLHDCNIRHLNFHALRHTFATRCIEVGVDMKTLSEMLGHSNASITMNIYVHSSLELKRSQIELLSSIHE